MLSTVLIKWIRKVTYFLKLLGVMVSTLATLDVVLCKVLQDHLHVSHAVKGFAVFFSNEFFYLSKFLNIKITFRSYG